MVDGRSARLGGPWPGGRPAPLTVVLLALTLVGGLLVGALGGTRPAAADEPPRSTAITGWLPSWSTGPALAGIEANANLLGEASPFWYTAKASNGKVTISASVGAATMTTVLDSLRSRGSR